jgi:hypothetical protein
MIYMCPWDATGKPSKPWSPHYAFLIPYRFSENSESCIWRYLKIPVTAFGEFPEIELEYNFTADSKPICFQSEFERSARLARRCADQPDPPVPPGTDQNGFNFEYSARPGVPPGGFDRPSCRSGLLIVIRRSDFGRLLYDRPDVYGLKKIGEDHFDCLPMKGIRELYLWLFLSLSKSRHPDTNPAGREDFEFPVSLQKYTKNFNVCNLCQYFPFCVDNYRSFSCRQKNHGWL